MSLRPSMNRTFPLSFPFSTKLTVLGQQWRKSERDQNHVESKMRLSGGMPFFNPSLPGFRPFTILRTPPEGFCAVSSPDQLMCSMGYREIRIDLSPLAKADLLEGVFKTARTITKKPATSDLLILQQEKEDQH